MSSRSTIFDSQTVWKTSSRRFLFRVFDAMVSRVLVAAGTEVVRYPLPRILLYKAPLSRWGDRGFQASRHIAPSLRLFVSNSLTAYHRSFLSKIVFATSVIGSPSFTLFFLQCSFFYRYFLSCPFLSHHQFYFVIINFKIIGHGNPDNNLESSSVTLTASYNITHKNVF
jgi:hypothetical protein